MINFRGTNAIDQFNNYYLQMYRECSNRTMHETFLYFIGVIHQSLNKYMKQKSSGCFEYKLDQQFANEVFIFLETQAPGEANIVSLGNSENINHSLVSQIKKYDFMELAKLFVRQQKEKIDVRVETFFKNLEQQNRLTPKSSAGFVNYFGVRSDTKMIDQDRRRREHLFNVPHTSDYEERLKKLGYGVKRKHRLTYNT